MTVFSENSNGEPKIRPAPSSMAGSVATRAATYFLRHWRGEFSLGVSFWRHGVPVLIALYVFTALMSVTGRYGGHSWTRGYAKLWAFVLFGLVWFALRIWANIGIWRSANHSGDGRRQGLWAWLAKLFVTLAMVFDLGMCLVLVFFPGVYIARVALGINAMPKQMAVRVSHDGRTAFVSGDVGEGSAVMLMRALRRAGRLKTVQLSSFGGLMYEAIDAANEINRLGLDTYVGDHCASACTIMFMAGRQRSLAPGATLSFHKPTLSSLLSENSTTEDSLKAFRAYGATAAFIDRLRALKEGEVWQPNEAELRHFNLISPM